MNPLTELRAYINCVAEHYFYRSMKKKQDKEFHRRVRECKQILDYARAYEECSIFMNLDPYVIAGAKIMRIQALEQYNKVLASYTEIMETERLNLSEFISGKQASDRLKAGIEL